jgi:cleavage and polyadenylation specificity factor subunit 3
MGVLDVKRTAEHELTLEWESNASNDMIADSTLALITGIDKSPASVKRTPLFSLIFSTELPNASHSF